MAFGDLVLVNHRSLPVLQHSGHSYHPQVQHATPRVSTCGRFLRWQHSSTILLNYSYELQTCQNHVVVCNYFHGQQTCLSHAVLVGYCGPQMCLNRALAARYRELQRYLNHAIPSTNYHAQQTSPNHAIPVFYGQQKLLTPPPHHPHELQKSRNFQMTLHSLTNAPQKSRTLMFHCSTVHHYYHG